MLSVLDRVIGALNGDYSLHYARAKEVCKVFKAKLARERVCSLSVFAVFVRQVSHIDELISRDNY